MRKPKKETSVAKKEVGRYDEEIRHAVSNENLIYHDCTLDTHFRSKPHCVHARTKCELVYKTLMFTPLRRGRRLVTYALYALYTVLV